MDREALIRRLEQVVGPQGVISERNQLRTYECDGLANFRVIPSVVVLPETADQARDTVRKYEEAGVERIMLQDFLPWDLEMIDIIGEALIGQV